MKIDMHPSSPYESHRGRLFEGKVGGLADDEKFKPLSEKPVLLHLTKDSAVFYDSAGEQGVRPDWSGWGQEKADDIVDVSSRVGCGHSELYMRGVRFHLFVEKDEKSCGAV
ncbi:MAG: hypothetical protein ABH864_01235 [archaeon]